MSRAGRIRIELNPPVKTEDLAGYCAKVEHLLRRTSRVSLTSHQVGGVSGFERSLNLIKHIRSLQWDPDTLFHLTCRDVSRSDLTVKLQLLSDLSIKKLLLLSGENYTKTSTSEAYFENSGDLLDEVMRSNTRSLFNSIAIAGFPGGNGTVSNSDEEELERLSRRLQTGAIDTIYTQCIFEFGKLKHFADCIEKRCNKQVEVVPSIALFKDLQSLERVVRVTRASSDVGDLQKQLSVLDGDGDKARDFSKLYLINLCRKLLEDGFQINMCLFGQIKLATEIIDAIES